MGKKQIFIWNAPPLQKYLSFHTRIEEEAASTFLHQSPSVAISPARRLSVGEVPEPGQRGPEVRTARVQAVRITERFVGFGETDFLSGIRLIGI